MTKGKWVLVMAVLFVATVIVAAYAAGQAAAPAVIRAQRFELVDKNGKACAVLAPMSDGNPSLVLIGGKDGNGKAALTISQDGNPSLILGKDGKPLVGLGPRSDGHSGLVLFDKEGTARAGMGVNLDGSSSGLTLFGKDGKPSATLQAMADGESTLSLFGNGGKACAMLSMTLGKNPTLTLMDKDENIWSAP